LQRFCVLGRYAWPHGARALEAVLKAGFVPSVCLPCIGVDALHDDPAVAQCRWCLALITYVMPWTDLLGAHTPTCALVLAGVVGRVDPQWLLSSGWAGLAA